MKALTLLLFAFLLLLGCSSHARKSKTADSSAVGAANGAESPNRPAPPRRSSFPRNGVYGDYAGYPALDQFINRMVSKHGFKREYLYEVFSQAHRKEWTLNYLSRDSGDSGSSSAPPRAGAWTRYRSKFLTEEHISAGTAYWHRYGAALKRASERYGVPPEYILGIMGVETIYGKNIGSHRVIDALTTLAFDYPRRGSYFAEELEHFLVMTQNEHIDPLQPVGSYAGAMGLGQFMPSSFLSLAVDFNGDGRRNLWNPEDAIGSIANYFVKHGWHKGEAVVTAAEVTNWTVENLKSGFDTHYPVSDLMDLGLQPLEPLPPSSTVRLLRLRGDDGDQYWLGHQNFYVITRYNHSTHYAMAVHELAQAIKQRYFSETAAAR